MPISAVVREIGDVTACISENCIFYVFVEVLLRKREVTRHSCVFTPSGAMALWRVGSLALVPAWQHGTDSDAQKMRHVNCAEVLRAHLSM